MFSSLRPLGAAVLLVLAFSTPVFARIHIFKGLSDNSRSWSSNASWIYGGNPGTTLGPLDTAIIEGSCVIDQNLNIILQGGSIWNRGSIFLRGTLSNSGTIFNDGTFTNNGAFSNNGLIRNNGTFQTNYPGSNTNPSFNAIGTSEFRNRGFLNIGAGTIFYGSTRLDMDSSAGFMLITSPLTNLGTITSVAGSTITAQAQLDNSGTLITGGSLIISPAGTIRNIGSWVNSGPILDSGNIIINPNGSFSNDGSGANPASINTFNNAIIDNGGSFTANANYLNRNSFISICPGCKFINEGIATIGMPFGNAGQITNNMGATFINQLLVPPGINPSLTGWSFMNAGSVYNFGAFNNNNTLANSGSLNTQGTFTNASVIHIIRNGNITVDNSSVQGSVFFNQGVIDSSGALTNNVIHGFVNFYGASYNNLSGPGTCYCYAITSQPQNATVVAGGIAGFRFQSTGIYPYNYSWIYSPDGVNWQAVPPNGSNFYSNGNDLLIRNVPQTLNGYMFRCSVSARYPGNVTSTVPVMLTVTATK